MHRERCLVCYCHYTPVYHALNVCPVHSSPENGSSFPVSHENHGTNELQNIPVHTEPISEITHI